MAKVVITLTDLDGDTGLLTGVDVEVESDPPLYTSAKQGSLTMAQRVAASLLKSMNDRSVAMYPISDEPESVN